MKKFVLMLLIVQLALAGCSRQSDVQPGGGTVNNVELPKCSEEGQCMYLINRYSQKLLTYNEKTKSIEEQQDIPNYIYYEFNTISPYFTVGNSLTNGFSILRIDKDNVTESVLLKDRKNEAIFPLATNGERYFFIHSYYDDSGKETKRTIAELINDSTKDLPNVSALVSYGTIVKDKLYYTVYDETSNSFNLQSLLLNNLDAAPRIEADNLETGELYSTNGELLTSSNELIFNDRIQFEKKTLNYIDDKHGILIQIYPNQQADLVLDVIDIASKKQIGSASGVIDFSVDDQVVTVYCEAYIKQINIP
ncbi:hypothetical protein [Paenibacillus sp. FSL H8-0537]|uniref:hypothetical protein n=1 Tax=Paenibacillus sp. FSL H8-0537 TaxID=2921399 RepID=UPI003101374A